MSRFLDLMSDPRLDPADTNRRFRERVAASPFRLWSPGAPIPEGGVRLLVGIATWSAYDLRLLDLIEETPRANWPTPLVLELFNTDDCRSLDDFDHYVPGLGQVFHTPVVGLWRDGRLTEKAEGYAARDLVARMFGSSSDAVVRDIDAWRAERSRASLRNSH
jgi:hypothetical protein